MEKLDNIQKAFYNIRWYELALCDQKLVLIALNCRHVQVSFESGKVYKIGYERFWAMMESAYSYLLVFKEFIINK